MKLTMMPKLYHYYVVNSLTKKVILTSLKDGFDGYEHEGRAHLCGLASKYKHNLSDFHQVKVLPNTKQIMKSKPQEEPVKKSKKKRVVRLVRTITASSNFKRIGMCIVTLIETKNQLNP